MKFRRLTAELVTEDIPGTIEYYTKTLGLELDSVYPNDVPIPQWVQFKCNNDYLMFESRKSLGQVIPEIQLAKLAVPLTSLSRWKASSSITRVSKIKCK